MQTYKLQLNLMAVLAVNDNKSNLLEQNNNHSLLQQMLQTHLLLRLHPLK